MFKERFFLLKWEQIHLLRKELSINKISPSSPIYFLLHSIRSFPSTIQFNYLCQGHKCLPNPMVIYQFLFHPIDLGCIFKHFFQNSFFVLAFIMSYLTVLLFSSLTSLDAITWSPLLTNKNMLQYSVRPVLVLSALSTIVFSYCCITIKNKISIACNIKNLLLICL